MVNQKAVHFMLLVILLFSIFYVVLSCHLIGVNVTGSMPRGLYRRVMLDDIHRGDVVAACLSIAVSEEGLKANYLFRGRCHDGVMPVLKEVIALPSDFVTLSNFFIEVNGKRYSAPHHHTDRQHRLIHRFVLPGSYRSLGYWLYGCGDSQYSWDSRYFGAVSRRAIIGVYRLVVEF